MPHNSRSQYALGRFGFNGPPPDFMGEDIYESRWQNITSSNKYQPLMIGTIYHSWDGKIYTYTKFSETSVTAAAGHLLSPIANDTTANITGSSNTVDEPYVEDSAEDYVAGALRGYYLYINGGTGAGQTRRIVNNTTTRIYVSRAFDTALSTDSDLIIWSPNVCRKSPAALTSAPAGVSIGTIADGSYGWMQVYGLTEAVIAEAAMTQNGFLTPSSATAGQAQEAGADETIDDAAVFGRAVQAGGTDIGVPAFLFACTG